MAFGPGGAPAEGGIVRCAAFPSKGPPLWLHDDLHPANVVVSDGTLSGVIDFGDMCVGDPADDLAAAWVRARGGLP